jgi:hypothetical protein
MDAEQLAGTLVQRIDARTSLADLYADDAILDANVPDWRFQLKGADTIAAQFLDPEWWPPETTAVVERTTVSPRTVTFELRSTFERDGGTWLSRNVHILELGALGLITRHTFYCTGEWSPETIARQAIEAPMVE